MAQIVKARLLRPLNGEEIGTVVEYDERDAERLAARGCVEILGGKPTKNKAMTPGETKPRRGKSAEHKDG